MRLYSFRSACLLSAACLVTLTWIRRTPGDEASAGSSVSPEMENLYNRLLAAEGLGRQVSRDLSSILWQLGNVSTNVTLTNTTNTTYGLSLERHQTGDGGGSMFPLPNIYSYMPHLRQHPDSLVPNIAVGQGRRGVSLVLGIPTVKRAKQSYLVNTLSSLLYSLTLSQSQDLIIIIFVAETDTDYVNSVAETIRKNFPREVQAGLLEVVSPSQYYYPDFNSIQETFGDSKDRVKWRTKQNLDFSFLMLYSQDKGTYYVQLEDDIVAREGYYNNMKAFAVQEASKPWLYLEFSQLGFIGKMFRTRDLSMIAEFFLMFHRDKPIDWLLDHILWVKVCNPEKDTKHCNEQKASLKRMYKPSLFQHVGLHSSLPGKLQHLKDKDFGKQTLYRAHNNPVAELSSSLKHYQEHSLERAYKGEDFFWAVTPIQGDYILLKFPEPIHISRYLFRSGNIETSLDKFYNTTVEVLPSSTLTQDKLVSGWSTSHHRELDKYFITIGEFENGEAKGELKQELQPVAALRLVVHSDSDVWAVLSEIHIEV